MRFVEALNARGAAVGGCVSRAQRVYLLVRSALWSLTT
jgi:hypothetical protein